MPDSKNGFVDYVPEGIKPNTKTEGEYRDFVPDPEPEGIPVPQKHEIPQEIKEDKK